MGRNRKYKQKVRPPLGLPALASFLSRKFGLSREAARQLAQGYIISVLETLDEHGSVELTEVGILRKEDGKIELEPHRWLETHLKKERRSTNNGYARHLD